MTRTELAQKIYNIAHITGDFLLRSGQRSHEYFDKYRFEARPEILREIARQMAPLIPPDTEVLAGLEMGGIPIATALSLETGIPCCFVRKEAKTYGTCQFAEGVEIKGKKICIVEDVVSTGGQVILSTQDLRSTGAIVDTVLCVIHRNLSKEDQIGNAKLQLKSLFSSDELKKASEGAESLR